jgi:hypothetical protein
MLTMDGIYFAFANGKKALDLTVDQDKGVSALKLYGPNGRLGWSMSAKK